MFLVTVVFFVGKQTHRSIFFAEKTVKGVARLDLLHVVVVVVVRAAGRNFAFLTKWDRIRMRFMVLNGLCAKALRNDFQNRLTRQ